MNNVIVYLKNGTTVRIYTFREYSKVTDGPAIIIRSARNNAEIGLFLRDEISGVVEEA